MSLVMRFEVFAESKLVGEKGEFFTPREVVKTAIQIIKPQPQQSILDPACGSGGFLIYALEYVWQEMDNSKKYKGASGIDILKKDIAEKCFFGIDKEIDLVKIAKAYMAIKVMVAVACFNKILYINAEIMRVVPERYLLMKMISLNNLILF